MNVHTTIKIIVALCNVDINLKLIDDGSKHFRSPLNGYHGH